MKSSTMFCIRFRLQKMSTVDWLSKRIHGFGMPKFDWKKVNISVLTPFPPLGFAPPALLLFLTHCWCFALGYYSMICSWDIPRSLHNGPGDYSCNILHSIGLVVIDCVVQNLHCHFLEIDAVLLLIPAVCCMLLVQ